MISSLLFFMMKENLETNNIYSKSFLIRPSIFAGADKNIKKLHNLVFLIVRKKQYFFNLPLYTCLPLLSNFKIYQRLSALPGGIVFNKSLLIFIFKLSVRVFFFTNIPTTEWNWDNFQKVPAVPATSNREIGTNLILLPTTLPTNYYLSSLWRAYFQFFL